MHNEASKQTQVGSQWAFIPKTKRPGTSLRVACAWSHTLMQLADSEWRSWKAKNNFLEQDVTLSVYFNFKKCCHWKIWKSAKWLLCNFFKKWSLPYLPLWWKRLYILFAFLISPSSSIPAPCLFKLLSLSSGLTVYTQALCHRTKVGLAAPSQIASGFPQSTTSRSIFLMVSFDVKKLLILRKFKLSIYFLFWLLLLVSCTRPLPAPQLQLLPFVSL